MNVKKKFLSYLSVTFIIGIAIGALLNRAVLRRQVQRVMEIRAAGLLVHDAQRFIKPTTADQQLIIQKIIEKHAQSLTQIHDRFGTEIETEFKSLKAELDPVLTPEQKRQFEKMIPGRPPGPPRGRRHLPPWREPPDVESELEDLKRVLILSDEQAAKIKAVLEKFRSEAKSMMGKAPSPEPFNAFRQLIDKKHLEIEKLLTDEQKEKYARNRRLRFPGPDGRPGDGPPPRGPPRDGPPPGRPPGVQGFPE